MDLGLLLLRLVVGLTIAAHGPGKLSTRYGYGPDGTGQYLEGLGFHPGRRYAVSVGLAELVGGVLIALGFLTPVGSALVAATMLIAAVTVHAKNGFFMTGGGYEYNLVLGGAAASLAFTGAGALSIDRLAHLPDGGIVVGFGALAVALLGSIVQLAQRRVTAAPVPTAA